MASGNINSNTTGKNQPDNISRPIGAGGVIELNGEQFVIPPFTVRDIGLVEAYLIQKRRKAIIRLAEDCYAESPADVREQMRAKAWREANDIAGVSVEDCFAWMRTTEGVAFVTHLLVNRTNPGKFTLAEVQECVYQLVESGLEELSSTIDQVAGVDAAGEKTSS